MVKLGIGFLVLFLSGCTSTSSDGVYGLDRQYYGASEYCLELKSEAYKDVSNLEINDRYTRECEPYSGNAPPISEQNEDCVIDILLGGSCSDTYKKWDK